MTHSDKLFNRFDEAAKSWGAVLAIGELMANRKFLRAKTNYYTARKELLDYLESLERTIAERDLEDV
jgi:hypothetical protein